MQEKRGKIGKQTLV